MRRPTSLSWLPVLALALSACSDAGPAAPEADFDLDAGAPLAAMLPELAPEPGTAGTDRYVPVLERIFTRSVRVVREKAGDEVAKKLVAEARTLHGAVRTAREAGDDVALAEAVRKLEGFEARIGLRVFGVDLVRHVHGDAAAKLRTVGEQIKAAEAAGRDVARLKAGARLAAQELAAAREAMGNERPVVALVHAAHALDLVTRIGALLA